jgi:hypothetical protein
MFSDVDLPWAQDSICAGALLRVVGIEYDINDGRAPLE